MNKICTSIEQSKKLMELGIDVKTADMFWSLNPEVLVASEYMTEDNYIPCVDAIPAWSLAVLRNLLPTAIKPNKDLYLFESHNTFDNSWVYRYYNEDDVSYLYCKDINEVDACYEMIIKLNELKML